MSVVEITSGTSVDIAYTPDDLAYERSYRKGSRWHAGDTYTRVPGYPYEFDESGVARCLHDITNPDWNGGHPFGFYPANVEIYRRNGKLHAHAEMVGCGPFCQDCAAANWDTDVENRQTYFIESEEESEGGYWCEGCHAVILYPYCQSCHDTADTDEEFADYVPRDDYGYLCPKCAHDAYAIVKADETISFPICHECRTDRAPLEYPEPEYTYKPLRCTAHRTDETCASCEEPLNIREPFTPATPDRAGNDWDFS